MKELKYLTTICAIFPLLFPVLSGQNASDLEQECESAHMQQRIYQTCRDGAIYGCQRETRSVHWCQKTYACRGINRQTLTMRDKCAIICALMRLSARVPANQYWIDYVFPRSLTFLRLEKKYWHLQEERMSSMSSNSRTKTHVYEFFNDIANTSVAKITYKTSGCGWEWPDVFSQCSVDLRDNAQVRQFCRQEKISLCWIDRYDYVNDHCSRKYRCEGLTRDFDEDPIRKCGMLCWVFENAFMDFPHGNFPINQTTFDFLVHVKNSTSDSWDWKRNFVEVGLEQARKIVYYNFQNAFYERTHFDVMIQVASRHCYLEKPPVCRDQDFTDYMVGKIMDPGILPGCYFPSRLDGPFRRSLDTGYLTLPSPTECSVSVQCDFTRYFQRHGWHRTPWCRLMDWMYMKTVTWLGLGPRTDTSDMQTQLLRLNIGQTEAGGRHITYWVSTTLPLGSLVAFYDNFTGFTGGYFANHFAVHAVFQDCLQKTNGQARMRIQGTDHCPQRRYFNPNRTNGVPGCYSQGGVNSTASCTFVLRHPIEHKCTQLYWIIHKALFFDCRMGAHEENPLLNVTMQATDNNNVTTTRRLFPILRDRVQPYIKNFVVNMFTRMTLFRIDAQFPQ